MPERRSLYQQWRYNGAAPAPLLSLFLLIASGITALFISVGQIFVPPMSDDSLDDPVISRVIEASMQQGARPSLVIHRLNELRATRSPGTEHLGEIMGYVSALATSKDILSDHGFIVPKDALLSGTADVLSEGGNELHVRSFLEMDSFDATIRGLTYYYTILREGYPSSQAFSIAQGLANSGSP